MDVLTTLKLRLDIADDEQDELLFSLLGTAESAILARRYPFDEATELESRYFDLQVRIAIELYNKMGAEGQTAHSENGINRSYESAGISESLLAEVVPMAGARHE